MTDITPLAQLEPKNFALEDGEAHQIAQSLIKGGMRITQLRKFFAQLKVIEKNLKGKSGKLEPAIENQLLLLNVDLAYAFSRGLITKDFYDRLKNYLKGAESVENVRRLVQFLEAVIAFHKFEERKKGG